MTSKRRHRAILWAIDGEKSSFKNKSLLRCSIVVIDGKFKTEKMPILEPHTKAIWQPCQECGELNHKKRGEYFQEWGTCDMYCYAKLVGVNLYEF